MPAATQSSKPSAEQIKAMRAQGLSAREIGRQLGIPAGTACKLVKGVEKVIRKVKLSEIRVDQGTQTRIATDPGTVDAYAEAMAGGAEFPPIVVYEGPDGIVLGDGFHRYDAAVRNKHETILAEVRQGGRREALFFALQANATNGLRMTNADKRNAVTILLADAEWSQLSDRNIAEMVGVTHPFVGKVRAERSGTTKPEKPKADPKPETPAPPAPESDEDDSETMPDGSPVGGDDDDDDKPETPADDQGDAAFRAFLGTCPTYDQIHGPAKVAFEREARLYWLTVESGPYKEFVKYLKGLTGDAKGIYGPISDLIRSVCRMPHPRHWKACKGCLGATKTKDGLKCPECFGNGFVGEGL